MSRVSIYLFALGHDLRNAVFFVVSRIAKVVAGDGAVFSPGRLHGNPMILDRGEVVRTREAIDVQGAHHASNVCQVNIPSLLAGCTDPLVLDRKSLKNDVLVPLIGYWLAHDLETFVIAVLAVDKIIGIIAGLPLGVVFMVCSSILLCMAAVLLFHWTPRRMSVTGFILWRVLSMCFFKNLLAERAERKIWRLKRFWFEHVHVATAIELCAAVGFGPLLGMTVTLCR